MAVLGFIALKAYSALGARPIYTGDRRVWAKIGESSLLSWNFWFSQRPPTYPLVFKALDFVDLHVIWFQHALSACCWSLLAISLSRTLRQLPLLRVPMSLGVLGLGLSTSVHAWDTVIRSESVALSLTALALAFVLALLRTSLGAGRGATAFAGLTVMAAFWAALARDMNGYIALVLGVYLLLAALASRVRSDGERRRWPRRLVAVGFSLLLVGAAASANTRISGRYVFPLMNVIFKRVLPSRAKVAYFRDELGMPVSKTLMRRKGKFASSGRRLAFRAPELEGFREWVRTDGYAAYQSYLLAHFSESVREAYEFFPKHFQGPPTIAKKRPEVACSLCDAAIETGPIAWSPLAWCVGIAGIALASFRAKSSELRLLAGFSLCLLVLSLTQAYLTFHGDAMEVRRHGVVVGILLRLSALVTVVAAAAHLAAAVRPTLGLARALHQKLRKPTKQGGSDATTPHSTGLL